MELTLLYIYIGLFSVIYLVFKFVKKIDNPFRKIRFWGIQVTFAILLTVLIAFIILKAIGGPSDLRKPTATERVKLDSLTKNYECKINIEKDWGVVVDNKSGGRLYIILDFNNSKVNLCASDSTSLLREATQISQNFQSVMDKKEMYEEIAISFYTSDLSVKGMEKPTCEKTFVFSVPSNKFVEYKKLGSRPTSVN